MHLHEDRESHLLAEIEEIINTTMEKHGAIKGISIGTAVATNIFTKLRSGLENYSEVELVAAATSFQYIAKNLFEIIVKNKLNSTYVTVENDILLLIIVKDISASIILDRKLAELEGIKVYQKELQDLVVKIAAVVETSDLINEDPFARIKRAVPSAFMVGIISKEGMPIKIEGANMQDALVSSMIAAISNLTNVILKKPMDYSVLQGINGNILVVQFDESRVLTVAVPGDESEKIGLYLAKIAEIIHEIKTDSKK